MPNIVAPVGKQKWLPLVVSLIVIGLVLVVGAGSALAAAKTLMLNPVRVIFTDRQRTVEVHVMNPTEESITYAISTVTMRKDGKGQLQEVTAESEKERSIRSMVRFSPRRATIEPGKRQVVKLMVNKPGDLAPGEYQTRLRFSPQPTAAPTTNSGAPAARKGSQFNVEILVDSTIPIIIQHGGIAAEVAPLALAVKQSTESPSGVAAEVKLSRSGNASAFGNVFLHYVPANDPKASRAIGQAQGVAIYLPEVEKKMLIPLTDISRQELSSGSIRVSFLPGTGSANQRENLGQKAVKDFPLR